MKTVSKENNCDTCERRFKCLTTKDGEPCPIMRGDNITWCHPYCNNMYVSFLNDNNGRYRIKGSEVRKLLRKAKFKTTKKYNRIYLEVIDEESDDYGVLIGCPQFNLVEK